MSYTHQVKVEGYCQQGGKERDQRLKSAKVALLRLSVKVNTHTIHIHMHTQESRQ